MKLLSFLVIAALSLVSFWGAGPAWSADADRVDWIDQFGTAGFDTVDGVSTDADFAYATGRVGFGLALPGGVSAGGADSFLRKYDSDGTVVWTTQFGTSEFDGLTNALIDGEDLFVFGATLGSFPGETNLGSFDLFMHGFDRDGNPGGVHQFGTDDFDRFLSVASYEESFYVLGLTFGAFDGQTNLGGADLFVAELTYDGNVVWLDQFGTADSDPAIFTLGGIAVNESGIFVAASVPSALPDTESVGLSDGFVRKYSHEHEVVWTQQIGTACTDLVTDVELLADGVVITGVTLGDLTDPHSARCIRPPEGQRDSNRSPRAFVMRLDGGGNTVWTRQYDGHGINDGDGFSLGVDLAVDATTIYVSGEAVRTPAAQPPDRTCAGPAGPREDIQVRAYDFDGDELWTQTIGTRTTDAPSGMSVNSSGVYVGGSTRCRLPGQTNAGRADAFMMKINIDGG